MPDIHNADLDCCQAFAASYDLSNLPAMRAIERDVLGCDFGGTSWTTCAQALDIARALSLGPGKHLLDIGAGSGWPGLFLARETGCAVTLLDLPENALGIARDRAEKEGIAERVVTVAASAASMPVADSGFDVISHSDLLCCLPEKTEVLGECRRVATDHARMHFSVISVPDGLDPAAIREAVEIGPPFVGADAPYGLMLEQTGWRILDHGDVTTEYRRSLDTLATAFETSTELVEIVGEEAMSEARAHRTRQISAIDRGLLIREVFSAIAA